MSAQPAWGSVSMVSSSLRRSQMALSLFPSDFWFDKVAFSMCSTVTAPLVWLKKTWKKGNIWLESLQWDSLRICCQPDSPVLASNPMLQHSISTGIPPQTLSAWQPNFHPHLSPGSLAANESLQEVFLLFASVINLQPWDHCTKT